MNIFSKNQQETVYASLARDFSQDQPQEKLAFGGVNSATVYTGIFDVNNILIHVGQNLVNFVAGTAVWFILGSMNLTSQRRALGRSLDEGLLGGMLEDFSSSQFSWWLRKIADTSDIIASLKDELWISMTTDHIVN